MRAVDDERSRVFSLGMADAASEEMSGSAMDREYAVRPDTGGARFFACSLRLRVLRTHPTVESKELSHSA